MVRSIVKSLTPTLAISVPLREQEYNQEELCTLFIHVHVPRPFLGELLVNLTSVV